MAERRTSTGFLPREHGFWVMLLAALSTAVARHAAEAPAWAAAVAVLAGASVAAGAVRHRVRREGPAQIASAGVLGCAGLPVELAAGAAFTEALVPALAWAAIFLANTLVVRAAFARAARRGTRAARLDGVAIALCTVAPVGFWLSGAASAAAATALAAVVSLALILKQPSVKHLKPVGIALAALSAVATLVLVD